ncbi:MerR family transcriptional regulator [Mycolicibacterium sediminis]|uniref:MerR family transcriptional regulator n=1 Tax=Mycolicibacterium sediminis TaxID=1286180 RepID=A0A7I7QQW0_9MYCO|nr:MerR family transcriptional regulator [Mycolicibacterium sediminis]BBY28779.1 MerR family transcriptional regulator [Mycolicibacterium sediminis]
MSRSTPAAAAISIGELSQRSGASPRMLRYYEQQGLLDPIRADNGYRRYRPDALTTVAQIRGLLDAGLPTDTIRRILPCAHGSEPTIDPCPEILEALVHERDRLDERIRHLSGSRDTLDRYLTSAQSSPKQD